MKIVLTESLTIDESLLEEYGQKIKALGHEFVHYEDPAATDEELADRLQDADIAIIASRPLPAGVIATAKKLRMIDIAFTGFDHVAMDVCAKRGITVCNAAGYSTGSVAEWVIGMTLAYYRKLKEADEKTRAHEGHGALLGQEIAGKTVGIIGTGAIGLEVARLFKAFRANVIAYSRTKKSGITYTDLDTLLKTSDIISIHLASNPQTAHFMDAEKFNKMKPTALFINAARGGVVNEKDLIEALREKKIQGACLDVYTNEPPLTSDDEILQAPDTLLSPHIGFYTREAMARRAEIVFANLFAYLDGHPQNQVN